ncbi:DUF6573 family protein [Luteimonas sp. MC1750]|uniref:DUF6573 family protein n=1 Tax=Luteimonas sp. MC1750 TaxID=2799326 RepID=UPI0018F0CE49|nr:DUF6573 family protein [Luteimonas sp. MC1750]MBJ6984016.1 hypothetical protein [Luteimonas sp. MC1750]QQO06828.1 hypothetical protein JGR68_05220 [Luteimonas sp. MC1750]
MNDFWGQPISIYTRAQALADGVLVDLTDTARTYGFKIPMACTSAVWHTVAWAEHIEQRKADSTGQSTTGRLHDVLTMARLAADAAAKAGASVVQFEVLMVPVEGRSTTPVAVSLRLVVSGGDDGEPVLTLMLPGED